MKREDLPSSEVLASIGLAAAGALAGLVARALMVGGKVVAAGLETVEHLLAGDHPSEPSSSATVTDLRERRDERAAEDIEAAPWADGVDALPTEPDFAAFEPADGLIPKTGRPAPRRSAAGAGRTSARPRPAKRATGRSVPPPLRPVRGGPPVPDDETSASTAEPLKGAAAAAEPPTPTKANAAKKTTAKKTPTKKTAAKATAAKKTAAQETAAETSAGRSDATKQAAATEAATTEAATTEAATPGATTESAPTAPATTSSTPSTTPATTSSAPPPATPSTTSSTTTSDGAPSDGAPEGAPGTSAS